MGSDYESSEGEREENKLELEKLRKEMISWDVEADKSSVQHDDGEEEYGSLQDQNILGDVKSEANLKETLTQQKKTEQDLNSDKKMLEKDL